MTTAQASSSMLLLLSVRASLLAIHHCAVAAAGMPEFDTVSPRVPGGASCCDGLSTNLVVLDILLMPRELCLYAGRAFSLSAELVLVLL